MRPLPLLAGLALTLAGLSCSEDKCDPMTPGCAVVRVEVSPSTVAAPSLGLTQQLTAVALDDGGKPVQDLTYAWASSDTDVATVDQTGLITTVANGHAAVTASVAGVSGSASVTVMQVPETVAVNPAQVTLSLHGETRQLTATASDGNGHPIVGMPFTWLSPEPGVATVDAGMVTAIARGRTTVIASAGPLSASAEVTVAVPFASMDPGSAHTCAVTVDGRGYCWGWDRYGELGDGVAGLKIQRLAPVLVAGGLSFAAISASVGEHTCGVTTDGQGYCWGWNEAGELGDGTRTNHSTPQPISGHLTFTTVETGGAHTCGLAVNGDAYCWGWNLHGQLGDGTTVDRTTPVKVVGGLTFAALSVGNGHTCGLAPDGQAYCWGYGIALGEGTPQPSSRSSPVPVFGGETFISLSAGDTDTCGITTGGVALCWGSNRYGELGDGTTDMRLTPVPVSGGLTFSNISVGGNSCGVTMAGGSYCWGWNEFGQIGDGTTIDRLVPTPVSGGFDFIEVKTGGGDDTCGLTPAGDMYCWGRNGYGELGTGTLASTLVPEPVYPPSSGG